MPCSAAAQQRHKIIRNGVALVGEESVSGLTRGSRRGINQENPRMRIYIIGNDGITLCREAPVTVNEGEIAVASKQELHAAPLSGKRLLALWNTLPGVEKRRKVGDREALIDQLWSAVEALPEPEPLFWKRDSKFESDSLQQRVDKLSVPKRRSEDRREAVADRHRAAGSAAAHLFHLLERAREPRISEASHWRHLEELLAAGRAAYGELNPIEPGGRSGTESSLTRRWREADSNFQFL